MLLAFDVGNTNAVLGVFKDKELLTNWRLQTEGNKSADEYGMILKQLFEFEGFKFENITDIVISTVVPSLLYTLQNVALRYFGIRPLIVDSEIETGLKIMYDNPKQVGADRIVNAVAAFEKYGGPLIVIDFGTATTFCAISENAEYLGGTIAPGVKITSDALFEKTAKLPKVELEATGHVICRNTVQSIQSGLVYGHMGTVDYIVKKMKSELEERTPTKKPVKVIATGGLANLMEKGVPDVDCVDRFLTLEGLQKIYEKNRNKI